MATYNRNLTSGGRLTLTVTTESQNIANNTSRIKWSLTLTDVSDIRMWASGSWSWSVKIGGTTLGSGTRSNYDFRNYDTLTLGSGTSTITHNSDGTRSDNWYGAFTDIGAGVGWFGNGTASGSYTIKTIPRATTAKWNSTGTKYVGTTQRLDLPRASSSFTHNVTYKFGSKSGTVGTGLGTYVNWAIPVALLTEFPNSASGSGTFTTVTKNGSTTIGSKTSSFTLTARATDVPTVSSVLWDDDNPVVKANIGAFVQDLSLIKGSVTASGVYGSTITERRLRIDGTTIPEGVPVQINGSGTVVATGEAVDSRGKVGSAPANFNVLPYEAPTLGSGGWQVSRANASNVATDLGQYLRIDLHAVAASLKVASVEKNALRIAVRTKASDGAWINRNVINPGLVHNGAIQVSGGAQFVVSKSYEVEVSLSDNTGTAPTVLRTTIPTATVTLDLSGTSVGVGKYHERGALDVGGDAYADTWNVFKSSSELTKYGHASITTPYGLMGTDFRGTSAQRVALGLSGEATEGLTFFDTDENREYVWRGGQWRDPSGQMLWEGGWFMHETQTATLSEPISAQKNGIILAFSEYTSGATRNYGWHYLPVSREHVLRSNGAGVNFLLGKGTNPAVARKYLYIHNTKIDGHEGNNDAPNDGFVLREVRGF